MEFSFKQIAEALENAGGRIVRISDLPEKAEDRWKHVFNLQLWQEKGYHTIGSVELYSTHMDPQHEQATHRVRYSLFSRNKAYDGVDEVLKEFHAKSGWEGEAGKGSGRREPPPRGQMRI